MLDDSQHQYKLKISEEIEIDLMDFKDEGIKAFILGMSGSGKSNAAKVMIEELINLNYPIIILDPEGEYASFKEKYDNFLVIGGKYGKIPINKGMITDLILLFYKNRNLNLIFDTSELEDEENTTFSARVLERIYNEGTKYRLPVFLIIEECSKIAPETTRTSSSLKWSKDIISRGRKRGIHSIWISQRTAHVNKNIISQCNLRLIGQITEKNDLNHIKNFLTNAEIKETQVMDLDLEFFFITKKMKEKIKFRKATVKDLASTPLLHEEIMLIEKKNEELDKIIAELIKKAEEKTAQEKEETTKIQDLEKQLQNLENNVTQKDEEISRLEQTLDIATRLKPILDGSSMINNVDVQSLTMSLKEKDDLITQLRKDNIILEERLSNVESFNHEQEEIIKKLGREVNEKARLITNTEKIKFHVGKLVEIFNLKDHDHNLQHVKELEEEIERLKNEQSVDIIKFEDRMDFVKHPEIQKAINNAMRLTVNKTALERILTFLIKNDGPASYSDIQKAYNYSSNTSISSAATTLESKKIIKKVSTSKGTMIDLDLESLPKIIIENKKRERIEEERKNIFRHD